MKKIWVSVISILTGTNMVFAASLLSAQKFPSTFNDLGFEQRMDILAAGFEPFETEYDETTGKCISNCPYQSITIGEAIERDARHNAAAAAKIERITSSIKSGSLTTKPTNIQNKSEDKQVDITTTAGLPTGMPLAGAPRITSEYGWRMHPTKKVLKKHDGIDFAAPIGTPVYAPGDGTVKKVWSNNACGRAIRIQHAQDYTSTYCHLSQQLVSTGDVVKKGQKIALTGNTGDSTGPHLHYGIEENGEPINPTLMFKHN